MLIRGEGAGLLGGHAGMMRVRVAGFDGVGVVVVAGGRHRTHLLRFEATGARPTTLPAVASWFEHTSMFWFRSK